MEPAEVSKAPASAVYDSVPVKADEITREETGNGKKILSGLSAGLAQGSTASAQGYKENLEELQKILKLLESERSQMSQRQEHLVYQHAKIDLSLQVILDEIAALKAQTALENDLNVLMVQFIVLAVRLLVEAAFNKDKVGELLPSLEAELRRLNLPARHPRLLACFNRLREVCGKAPVSQKDLSPVAVVVSGASTSEVLRDGGGFEGGPPRLNAARSGSGSSSGESLPVKRVVTCGEGQTSEKEAASPRADARTSLVDESDDEKKRWPGSSSGEKSPTAAASAEEAQLRLSKTSASSEFSPRRESVFTPKERRRTATAFGDGDLPLFQQFAVAAAAPAPDAYPGLRLPMDTATLSKSCRAGGVVCDWLHAEVLAGKQTRADSADALSPSFNKRGGDSAEGLGSFERNEEGLQKASSREVQTAQESPAESSLSVDGLLKHATTILSMSPSELRAALLQSASGAKFYSGIQQEDAQGEGSSCGRKEGLMSSGDRLDSEGPLAPMSSLAEPVVLQSSKDQLQLLQDAVVAMARAVSGDFKDNTSKQQRGNSNASQSVVAAGAADATQQQQGSNASSSEAAAAAATKRGKEMSEGSSSSFQAGEPNPSAQVAASPFSPAVSSPFAGRIAPPSTPDGLTYACGQMNLGEAVQAQAAAPGHISAVYGHPDQKHWQQLYIDAAAAAQQQRKEHALLESHYITFPSQWSGGGGSYGVYAASFEKGGPSPPPPEPEPFFDSERFFGGNGLVYGSLRSKDINVNNPPPSGSSRVGAVSGVYAAPVRGILPPLNIANPRARSAAKEQQRGCCPPRVLLPCMLGWPGKQGAAAEKNNTIASNNNNPFTAPPSTVPQKNAFETPRVEGGWACCRGLTSESKGAPTISDN
ncbi:hypothetical protein Esti_005113 [Eimeria stiedai]